MRCQHLKYFEIPETATADVVNDMVIETSQNTCSFCRSTISIEKTTSRFNSVRVYNDGAALF